MGKISIRTEFYFEAAHMLDLDYESKCEELHGHSYKCAVTITKNNTIELDQNNMIIDFAELKKIIKERIENVLDHKYLNNIFDFNPTAERMSIWIADQINDALYERNIDAICSKVELNETAKNMAIYEA